MGLLGALFESGDLDEPLIHQPFEHVIGLPQTHSGEASQFPLAGGLVAGYGVEDQKILFVRHVKGSKGLRVHGVIGS